MASAADQAEQRIREQRRLIEEKLARLETRVKDDISTAQSTTRERTQDVTHSIPGRQRIERQVEERPLTTLAAGLAAGMAMGMLSESISLGGGGANGSSSSGSARQNPATSGGNSGGGGAGMMSQLIGPATAAIIGPVQSQLQDFVSSALSGLSGNGQRSDTEAEREEAAGQLARSAERRQEVAAGAASGDSSN
jgi:ElaB/YqjD/DUF883 family membrane-anchored ribosome-binding protein